VGPNPVTGKGIRTYQQKVLVPKDLYNTVWRPDIRREIEEELLVQELTMPELLTISC